MSIGKCSCLSVKDFKLGDRVKVVFIETLWKRHFDVGSIGTVLYIGASNIDVRIEGYGITTLASQRLVKIK
jgi:hypothetical protein